MSTHLRIAATVCVLSTGLLISGPGLAMAGATPDAGGSAASTGSDSGDGASTKSTTSTKPSSGPIGGVADAVHSALQNAAQDAVAGVTGTLTSIARTGQQFSSIATSPRTTFGGTPTVHGSLGTTKPVPPADSPTSPDSTTVPVAAKAVPPVQPVTAALSDYRQPVSNAIAAATQTVTSSVQDTAQSAAQSAAASNAALLAALPNDAAPLADVVTSVQNLLTSVSAAGTSLLQVQTQLSDLFNTALSAPGTTVPVTTAAAGAVRIGPPAGRTAAIPSVPAPPAAGSVQVPPAMTEIARPATPLKVSATATVTSRGIIDAGLPLLTPPGEGASVLSIVEHVIGAVVATVSLTALLAMALPGIGGLLGVSVAGARIGYRQAKASSALPSTAISRFIGSGPVGIVRSGSQVAVHQRTTRPGSRRPAESHVVEPVAVASVRLLDRTA